MIKKERVLIVHNYYQIPGGEDTVVANEKKMLEDNGHEVILYSRNNSELKTMSKLKKMFLPINTIFSIKTFKEIKRLIKENNIDVVHVHNTLNLISPSVYYAALACKVPVVQTIHNFRLVCPGATFYRDGHICEDCIKYGLRCAAKHKCYRDSKIQTLACILTLKVHRGLGIYKKINYICLTEFNKEKLLSLKQIKPEKVFIKPNFIESSCTVSTYSERNNNFIYVGRLDKLKGIDILLESWKEVEAIDESMQLLICGTGPMKDYCEKFIQKNKLVNVKMEGFVKNEKVKNIIATSKALILPTQWYEGFPMSIVEAYSVGTPVIGSNIGNVNDLIIEGVTGLKFSFDNSSELKKSILHMNDMVQSTSRYYEEKYTSEKNYNTLLSIYKSCKNRY